MTFQKRYLVLACLSMVTALLSQFPASWAAKLAGLPPAVKLGGVVWNGYVPPINAVPPIRYKTRLGGLFGDTPLIEFNGSGNGLSLDGTAKLNKVSQLTLRGDAFFLGQIDGRLSNLQGVFNLNARDIKFNGDCDGVSGQISTDILTRNKALWQWEGPALSGPITCENGILTSTLSGNIPGQSVEAVVKIIADGTFQIRAVINTNTAEAGLVLPLYGFEAQGERYTLNEAGRWM